jgi:hypothetical protein
VQQTNRPHGWAFHAINGGIIKDMKLWKPVAWSFSTSGSSNVHAFNNKILAVSDTSSFPFNTSVALVNNCDFVMLIMCTATVSPLVARI